MDESDKFEDIIRALFEDLRKNATIQAGAVMFGQAQVLYYDVLKQNMSEEQAYDMLAHTTGELLKAIANAAGPISAAVLGSAVAQNQMEKEANDKKKAGKHE